MTNGSTEPQLSRLTASISARMERAHGVGFGLGVSIPGEQAFVFSGEAVAGSGRPIGPSSRFPIACLMKLLVSIRCLQLIEAGRLKLDDLVCDHAPDLRSGDPRRDSLRLRHLLSHTAGYVEPGNEHRWNLSWETFRAFFIERRQAFRPGDTFSYTQTGHCILARIIETTDTVSIFESVETHILRPLGVSGSWRDPRSPDDVALHFQRPTGLAPFQTRRDTGILQASIGHRRLTVADMLLIGEALVGRHPRGGDVVNEEIRRALFGHAIEIPMQTSRPGVEDMPIAYGLGLARYRIGHGHNGSYVGAALGLRVCPVTQAVTVAATNTWAPIIRDHLLLSALTPLARPATAQPVCAPRFDQHELAGHYQALMLGSGDIRITGEGRITEFGGMPADGHVLAQPDGGVTMDNNLHWAALAAFRDGETGEPALVSMMSAYKKYPADGLPGLTDLGGARRSTG